MSIKLANKGEITSYRQLCKVDSHLQKTDHVRTYERWPHLSLRISKMFDRTPSHDKSMHSLRQHQGEQKQEEDQ